MKRHHVEELEDGEWTVVHQHEEEYPVKNRPPSCPPRCADHGADNEVRRVGAGEALAWEDTSTVLGCGNAVAGRATVANFVAKPTNGRG